MRKKRTHEPITTRCLMCNTYAGCSKHHLYKCVGCKLVYSWAFGASDDMPDHCDDCWAKAHAKEVA
jgi:hypothetical protein